MAGKDTPLGHLLTVTSAKSSNRRASGSETLLVDIFIPDKYADFVSLEKVFDVISAVCSCQVQCTQRFTTIEIRYS